MNDYGGSIKSVRGNVIGLYIIEPLPDVISSNDKVSQAKMEFFQVVDFGGIIPAFVVNSKSLNLSV